MAMNMKRSSWNQPQSSLNKDGNLNQFLRVPVLLDLNGWILLARIDNEVGIEFNMLTISPHTSPAHVLFFFFK